MNFERSTDHKLTNRTIGFETTLMTLADDITAYPENKKIRRPYVALVKGQIGSGKTALMKHLFRGLLGVNSFQPYLERHKKKLPIFTSWTNAETTLQFLNIWRPIFAALLLYHCKKSKLNREHVIAECIIKTGNEDKADLICELVGV